MNHRKGCRTPSFYDLEKSARFSPGLLRISKRLLLPCSLVTLNSWLPRINLGWGFPSLHKVLLCLLVVQTVNNLPAMRETQVWSLGQEDPLEKGMATHSSVLVWRISWTEEPGGLQSMGSQRVGQGWAANIPTFKRVLTFLRYGNQTLLVFSFPYHTHPVYKIFECTAGCTKNLDKRSGSCLSKIDQLKY